MRRLCLGLLVLTLAARAEAFVLAEDELAERSTEIGIMARTFAFLLAGQVLRPPYVPEDTNPAAIGILDLRLSFAHRRPWLKVAVHNQLTGELRSSSIVGPLALGRGVEPPRWLPLDWTIAEQDDFTLSDSLDWAYVALTGGRVTVTAGRQPVTFGRGQLWKPEDLISTFALTEVDVEFKPGVDALRLDVTTWERGQVTLLAVAGKWEHELSLSGSSFALRAKQGWSSGEAGLLGGFIRGDAVVGLDGVVDAGPFDVYSEVTLTVPTSRSLTPRPPATPRAVVRAVAGATFHPTTTLTVGPEVYYNGFGAWTPADYVEVALSERVAVGELYSLGQLYLGGVGRWEVHPLLDLNLAAIVNLRDPSSLLALGLSYNVAANVELVAGGYLPLGRLPDAGAPLPVIGFPTPRSEYGLYPYFLYLELKAAM